MILWYDLLLYWELIRYEFFWKKFSHSNPSFFKKQDVFNWDSLWFVWTGKSNQNGAIFYRGFFCAVKKNRFVNSDFLWIDILNDNIPGKFSGNWLGYQLIWRYENQDSINILSINILSRQQKYKEIFFFNKSSLSIGVGWITRNWNSILSWIVNLQPLKGQAKSSDPSMNVWCWFQIERMLQANPTGLSEWTSKKVSRES